VRYGIAATVVKRMTAAKALQAQPYSFRGSVSFNRFAHVLGTRRMEAAGGGQERRNQTLVPAEGEDEASPDTSVEPEVSVEAAVRAHLIKRRLTSVCSSVKRQSRTFRRGLNTIDHSGLSDASSSRTASRIRRLMRLRTTALPSAFGAVKPTRGPLPCTGAARRKAAKRGHV
jgi:hypothetical protein